MDGNIDQVNTPGASSYRGTLLLAACARALGLWEPAEEGEDIAEDMRHERGLSAEPVCIPTLADLRFGPSDGARLRALVGRALTRIGDDAAFTTEELAVVTAIFGHRWLLARPRVAVAMVEGHLRAWARTADTARSGKLGHKPGRVTKAVRRKAGRVIRTVRRTRLTSRDRAGYVWLRLRPDVGEALPRAMAGAPEWSCRAWRFGLGTGLPFAPRPDATTYQLVVGVAGVQADNEGVPRWAALEVSNWVRSFGPRRDGVWQQLFAAAGVRE